jgi:hypothetical protein
MGKEGKRMRTRREIQEEGKRQMKKRKLKRMRKRWTMSLDEGGGRQKWRRGKALKGGRKEHSELAKSKWNQLKGRRRREEDWKGKRKEGRPCSCDSLWQMGMDTRQLPDCWKLALRH